MGDSMNLSNFDYVHIGNDKIIKELWLDIINVDNQTKPLGGFWTSPFNNIKGSISDWTDLIWENEERLSHFSYEHGCLIKLKDDANICYLSNDKEIYQIKQFYNMTQINYEKLSTIYDAVYVAPWSMGYDLRHGEFDKWSVRTLLIFNLDIIDCYIPIKIEKQKGFFITKTEDICAIKKPTELYYQICDNVRNLYNQKLNKIHFDNPLLLKQILEEIETEIYLTTSKKVTQKINDMVDNYYIIKAIIANEKHKQYQKRKF